MAIASALTRASSRTVRPAGARLVWGAVALTALALAIRFAVLSAQSFWLDEAYTEHLVHLSLGGMLSQIPRSESTPPLYYAVAWVWTHVFGYSEVGLRSLSALAGGFTVTLGYLLAARLGGLRAGLIAGLLMSVSPILVWYSQEARAYALATLLATATVLCLIRYADGGQPRWLHAWALTAALGLCTHYFVAFVLLGELAWLWRRRPHPRQARFDAALLVLVALALVPLALAQRGTGHADYIAQGSLATRLLQVPKQFLIGYASPGQAVTAPVAAAIIFLAALVPLWLSRLILDRLILLPLAAGLSVVILPSVMALIGVDFLDTRNVLPGLPSLLAVAAVGFAIAPVGPWRWVPPAALAVLCAVIVVAVNTDVQYQRTDWRGASQALGTATVPRAVVVSPGTGLLVLQIYLRRVESLPPRGAAVREIDVLGLAPESSSGRLGSAPPPATRPGVPSGFTFAGAIADRAYTVLRYRSTNAVTVTPRELAPTALGAGGRATLLQRPAG